MKHYKLLVVLLALLGTVSGCSDEWEGNRLRPSEQLCFTASLGSNSAVLSPTTRGTAGHLSFVEEEWTLEATATTKAAPVTALTGEAGIVGYVGDQVYDDLNNKAFTFNGDELTSAEPIYWKNIENKGTQLDIYAYVPSTISSAKYFAYTVPTEASKQTDILVATATAENSATAAIPYRQRIPLTFDHALTAIRFKMGFAATVKSITISGVKSTGTYIIGTGWTVGTDTKDYTLSFGDNGSTFAEDAFLNDGNNTFMLIPQTLGKGATVTLETTDGTYTTDLEDVEWKEGKLITYTLHKGSAPQYIYLDLAAGDVTINGSTNTYSGSYYKTENGETKLVTVADSKHDAKNVYYVYQSTDKNKSTTGLVNGEFIIPTYPAITYNNKPWSEFITNNTSVEDVIEIWDDGKNVKGTDATGEKHIGTAVVRDAGREHTTNKIYIEGTDNFTCNLTIDNIYSTYQKSGTGYRTDGTFTFKARGTNSQLFLNSIGDNRLGNIHYCNYNRDNGSAIVFEGTGSLTVADTDFQTGKYHRFSITGYYSNHHESAIGGSDSDGNSNSNDDARSCGIIFKSGVIFAGTTQAENCSAIGGGGNVVGDVTIDGGTITAVASTTGATIGGGIGFSAQGGVGYVTINGGNVYAYNFSNPVDIPSAAIGGGGSSDSKGSAGYVTITGGNVYAESALGTAIGGGSSKTQEGGIAEVTITGGTVIAKSKSALGGPDGGNKGKELPAGAGIGGGTGGAGLASDHKTPAYGGNATIKISGNPIIRTGSIGGGKTNNSKGTIGSAQITVTGGDTQAQFVMAAGAGKTPSFTMSGGLIRNSDTSDQEYIHIQKYGGAVYLEDGSFTMSGGTIENCRAELGGAVYIKGSNNTTFTMTGGTIKDCISSTHGGALYLEGGKVDISNNGSIEGNLAKGGNGGGICIQNGMFTMSGGSITKNSSIFRDNQGGNGGGVYITSTQASSATITSGSITGNTSDRLGGGICVVPSGDNIATVTFGVDGSSDTTTPSITNNLTLLKGGGLYAEGKNANLFIYSGKIRENQTTAYVANEDVANEQGMVTLTGGDVPSVEITFNANGGTADDGTTTTATQKIVTATNSILVQPTFKRTGYTFTGWNTRADGRGTSYTNGQVMNITTDLTLYAQWKL
ncbi:MAG: InlB B-repeat-containing protein [Bacteroides sp.]|nr:InlB B-repeat-containing protein [Bacteroides sp.]